MKNKDTEYRSYKYGYFEDDLEATPEDHEAAAYGCAIIIGSAIVAMCIISFVLIKYVL